MIDRFRGEYFFLSNFSPSSFRYCKIRYPTVEHAFQASKTWNDNTKMRISLLETPHKAKRVGRRIDLREDWYEVRVGIMKILILKKFRGKTLRKKLLATGDEELIEGNNWDDVFWGMCDGVGRNELGEILMSVRWGIRNA